MDILRFIISIPVRIGIVFFVLVVLPVVMLTELVLDVDFEVTHELLNELKLIFTKYNLFG